MTQEQQKQFVEEVVARILELEPQIQPAIVNDIYEQVFHARKTEFRLAQMRADKEREAIETFKYKTV